MPASKKASKKSSKSTSSPSPSLSVRLQGWARAGARFIARSSLPEIAFITCFILSRYLINADFSYPWEILPPLILFAVLASIVFYAYRAVLKNTFAAHVASLLLIYGFYNFGAIQDARLRALKLVLPQKLETTFTIALVLIIAMALLAYLVAWAAKWLVRRLPEGHARQPEKILLFIVVFVFAVQLVKTGSRLWSIRHELAYHYTATSPQRDPSKTVSKPDVYYIVLDRYGNSDTLKNIYDHDNSDFTDFLAGQGFVNRPDAYANYPFTMSSITSTLAMSYFPELNQKFGNDSFQTGFPYRDVFNDPPIAQILKQNGYQYNQVSSWWDFTRIGIKADNEPTKSFRLTLFGKQLWLSDLDRDIIYKSVFRPLFKKGITVGSHQIIKYDLDRNPRQNFEDQISALKDLSARQDKSVPQFSFAHILVPHDPYIFTADGSTPTYDSARTDNGVDETVKYANQVTYLNTRIEDLVQTVRKNSPNAAIIIQADEGPYPKQFRGKLTPTNYYDPANLPLTQMKQKFGILASYYMPGADTQTVQTQLDSSVNAFRFVLSHYLGYDLDPLPDCHFATGDKFVVYRYRDETSQLTGADPTACQQYLK